MIIFINLSDPTQPTNRIHDRPSDRPDRPDAFLSHSCIFEPCYQLANGFRHLKKVEAQHHSRSNRVSLFRWNTRDTSRWRFAGETRASNVTCIPNAKSVTRLTRVMLFNLECFLCKNAYVMQGCSVRTGAAGTICSEPKSESDIESGAATAPRKVVSNSYQTYQTTSGMK